jgi:hypothetical protein
MINVSVRVSLAALTLVCAGVASIALAQTRRPYPMTAHRIGSHVIRPLGGAPLCTWC